MRYALAAGLAAVAAFLLAPFLLREPAPPASGGASLERRFPIETAAFRLPAAEDARWREKRGHAFSLKDRDESAPDSDPRWARILAGRPKPRPTPGACLVCHAEDGKEERPYWEARNRAIGCADCHDPETAALRLTRPGFAPAATHEMRALVCAQCHREYSLAPRLTFPEGRDAGAIESFYLRTGFRDWTHTETGAAVLLPQHPQFEMYSQGVHARSGVACADCHMPFVRHGAVRIAMHNARSPLLDPGPSCVACHRASPEEMKLRAEQIQQRTSALLSRAQDALVALIDDLAGATGGSLDEARAFETKAQWRIAFVAADRSKGFHAPQEAARLLAEAIDFAGQGRVLVARAPRPAAWTLSRRWQRWGVREAAVAQTSVCGADAPVRASGCLDTSVQAAGVGACATRPPHIFILGCAPNGPWLLMSRQGVAPRRVSAPQAWAPAPRALQ